MAMKLYPNSKVYIFCPANCNSGGPELAHQLASALISFGVEAYMLYYELGSYSVNLADPVHDFYKKYHVPYVFDAEDNQKNIIIVPETVTETLYDFKKIRRVIWWMSVYFYLSHLMNKFKADLENPLAAPLRKFFYFRKEDGDINHFVQSEYARQFLKLNGIPDSRIYMVEDYLNQAFLSRAAQIDLRRKKNFVAFNPKKGFEVTKQLIELAPDIAWRPIQNMTPDQVQELLAASKVYIDFGNHPGKDRIPREAAISGCVVITNKRGAAANDIDINIPDEFKFDSQAEFGDVIKKIREVFENFSVAHEKQAAYRARILDDKPRFTQEVIKAFEIKKFPPPSIALTQGFSDASSLLAKKLQSQSLAPDFIVDDVMSTADAATLAEGLIFREQNRNYLRDGKNFTEIITRDDARFLYLEGRIKKFALLEPTDEELADLKDFYGADDADVLIF